MIFVDHLDESFGNSNLSKRVKKHFFDVYSAKYDVIKRVILPLDDNIFEETAVDLSVINPTEMRRWMIRHLSGEVVIDIEYKTSYVFRFELEEDFVLFNLEFGTKIQIK